MPVEFLDTGKNTNFHHIFKKKKQAAQGNVTEFPLLEIRFLSLLFEYRIKKIVTVNVENKGKFD